MSDAVDALILDLLEWVTARPRTYRQVIEAWRTSCPRLPVWEEANDRGLITRVRCDGGGTVICVTEQGQALLARHRRTASASGRAPQTPTAP